TPSTAPSPSIRTCPACAPMPRPCASASKATRSDRPGVAAAGGFLNAVVVSCWPAARRGGDSRPFRGGTGDMTVTTQAEIVIIGGGIIGCSVAYHLTRMGRRDVVIMEKSGLTHGATWHAAGLVGQLRSSRNTTRMLQRSVALYDRLEAETGQAIDWKKVGSLRLACSSERLLELKRAATMAKSFGLDMQLIGPKEAQDLFPIMTTDGVVAVAFLPSDGYVDPASLA